jgi:hypothetical protein
VRLSVGTGNILIKNYNLEPLEGPPVELESAVTTAVTTAVMTAMMTAMMTAVMLPPPRQTLRNHPISRCWVGPTKEADS